MDEILGHDDLLRDDKICTERIDRMYLYYRNIDICIGKNLGMHIAMISNSFEYKENIPIQSTRPVIKSMTGSLFNITNKLERK